MMAYQHQGTCMEGDNVSYQNKDGITWCGPAVIREEVYGSTLWEK